MSDNKPADIGICLNNAKTLNSKSFHRTMIVVLLVATVLHGMQYICDVYQGSISNISKMITTSILAVLIFEMICHYISYNTPNEVKEEYSIKTSENDDDKAELKAKVKKTLSPYITYQKDLDTCIDKIISDVDLCGEEVHDVFPQSKKPLEKDKYLPWQDSMLEPANPYSLATNISMGSISCPSISAYSPIGLRRKDTESSDIDSPKMSKPKNRRSINKGGRMSIRNSSGMKPRASLMDQRSSVADTIPIPKTHVNYYENSTKRDEVDSHAAWISFILFEETKKIERLAQIGEADEEISLALKKRSTMINVATTAYTKKNFTKKERNIEDINIIEFNNQVYDRRRASSVIKKVTTPMPKGIIECMKQFKTWNYDSFLLNELTSNNPLSFFMQYIFQAYSLDDKLDMDRTKFKAFFYEIQELYHKDNHYHNAIHASDVAQAVFYFLEKGGGNLK